jgi:excisionase family DNA binding protein
MAKEKMLTTPEAAGRLGITVPRVHQLIKAGRLPSQQFGRDHLIREEDLTLVSDRKPGRPKRLDKSIATAETPITRAEMKAGEVLKTPLTSVPRRTKAKKATNGAATKKAGKR